MTDPRLVRMIHVLVHMGLLGGRETSGVLAKMVPTNPVVVRRMLACLKASEIVTSYAGRGGGWKLLRPLEDITLLDVQQALAPGPILVAPLAEDHPTCPVERAANAALSAALEDAEEVLRGSLSRVTLAEVARNVSLSGGSSSG